MQARERLRFVGIPRQQIEAPSELVSRILPDQRRGRQIKELFAAKQPVPFGELGSIFGLKLRLVRGRQHASRISASRQRPQNNPRC